MEKHIVGIIGLILFVAGVIFMCKYLGYSILDTEPYNITKEWAYPLVMTVSFAIGSILMLKADYIE